jgi:tetratricopeptide (TPR) repeat protein
MATNREQRDPEAAIGFLLEALPIDPSYYYAERMLGLHYLRLGRLAETQHYWEAVHQTDPLSSRSNRELLLVCKLRKKWDQVRALISKNLKTAGDPVYWNRKLTELQFLQYGNKQAFITQRKAALASQDDPLEEAKIALLARDFDYTYDSLPNVEGADRLELIDDESRGNSLDFGTWNLLQALIRFHRAELNLGPKESNAVGDNPETEVVSNEDPNSPHGWAARAIYHALENDRAGMEKAILEARKLNSLTYWKYNFAVESELRISVVYLILGDHDKAIETLEAASKMDSPSSSTENSTFGSSSTG